MAVEFQCSICKKDDTRCGCPRTPNPYQPSKEEELERLDSEVKHNLSILRRMNRTPLR